MSNYRVLRELIQPKSLSPHPFLQISCQSLRFHHVDSEYPWQVKQKEMINYFSFFLSFKYSVICVCMMEGRVELNTCRQACVEVRGQLWGVRFTVGASAHTQLVKRA